MTEFADYGPPGEPEMDSDVAVYEWTLVNGRRACPAHPRSRVEYITNELHECSNGCQLVPPTQPAG